MKQLAKYKFAKYININLLIGLYVDTISSFFLLASKALEQSLDSLALTSFGVMDTTLEEVFLKVSEEDQSLENSDAGETCLCSFRVSIGVLWCTLKVIWKNKIFIR